MQTPETGKLLKLGDTDETIATPEEDIRNRHVKDRDGEDLGKISNLLVDESERKVRFIEIASGGFLGIGQDKTFIPVEAITSITGDEVRIDQTRERLSNAPAYDPELVRERDTYGSILDYYGYGPFWGPEYRYPDYPNYRY
ncbi:PRC-barrel domain-containing protein [Arthrobacter psychrolactophilus]|uniref:PRC-barrel domain-containing protein n=1 Tax=Arthrobacter psychrolactophilus TaxID=92442 RepID=A0A2V5IQ55_9MICC|nr:PRC-barrel domain-containing protein [Arthrobacter psychrolactophilus]PYI38699.1 PRC-barrel domain-containing protein [Arthrobacter psychrolactophilus]